jgi:hypothetical protein
MIINYDSSIVNKFGCSLADDARVIIYDRHMFMALAPAFMCSPQVCGLYNKPLMIVNDDSRVINKLETSLTDAARVVIYDRHMFIVQASGSWPYIRLALKGF